MKRYKIIFESFVDFLQLEIIVDAEMIAYEISNLAKKGKVLDLIPVDIE